jgi:hypothetical protein
MLLQKSLYNARANFTQKVFFICFPLEILLSHSLLPMILFCHLLLKEGRSVAYTMILNDASRVMNK